MRTKILSLFFIFSMLIGANSCDKDNEIFASMKATIDGNAWEASLASVVGAKFTTYITILGFNLSGEKISISIKGTEVGTYTFSALEQSTETYGIYLKDKDATTGEESNKYLTTQGTVEITEITDNKISGTFNFKAKNSLTSPEIIEITSGEFKNVPYF